MLTQDELHVATLGLLEKPSPLNLSTANSEVLGNFVPGAPRIRIQFDTSPEAPHQDLLFERAGPANESTSTPFTRLLRLSLAAAVVRASTTLSARFFSS
jgi:hypothetical protein